MSKYELMKQRAASAVMKQRETVRNTVVVTEILIGSAASGYVAQAMPTVAGVPTDAGLGIAFLAAGVAMKQRDLTGLGIGMLAGYARDLGAGLHDSYPLGGSAAPVYDANGTRVS